MCVRARVCVRVCVLGGVVPGIVNIELFFFFAPLLVFFFKSLFFFLRWENCKTHLDFLPSPSSPPSLAPKPGQGRKKQLVEFLGKSVVCSGPRVGRRRGGHEARRGGRRARGPRRSLRLNGSASVAR